MVNLDRVKLADAISRDVLSISASSVSGFRVQSGPVLVIPGLPELATVIEASLSGKLTFLITEQGKPGWFQQLVQESVQRGRPTALQRARAPQSHLPPARGARCHLAPNCRYRRPQDIAAHPPLRRRP